MATLRSPTSSVAPRKQAAEAASRARLCSADGCPADPACPRRFRAAGRASTARLAAVAGNGRRSLVGVAQLVELLVVVQAVAGSSPVAHPSGITRKQRVFASG